MERNYEVPIHEKALRGFGSGMVGFFLLVNTFIDRASAKVVWDAQPEKGQYEVLHTDEESGNRTTIRWKSYSDIGANVSNTPIENPLFERIRALKMLMPGVNETISDPQKFSADVWQKAEQYGVTKDKRAALRPQEAIAVTINIVQNNMRYADDIIPNTSRQRYSWPKGMPSYNPSKEKVLDEMPIDRLFTGQKEGVCRHYSVLVDSVYNVFQSDPACALLKNTIVRKLITDDDMHARNVVFEIKKNKNEDYYLDVAFVDTTLREPGMNFDSVFVDSLQQQGSIFPPAYNDYIQKTFSEKDRIESLRHHLKQQKKSFREAPSPHIIVAFELLDIMRSVQEKGNSQKAEQLLHTISAFIKEHEQEYSKYSDMDEYDLLYSIFYNVYRIHGDYEKDHMKQEEIHHTGMRMRMKSHQRRYDVFTGRGEIRKALREGEEHADFLARLGDQSVAEEEYHNLFELYKKNSHTVGLYRRAIREGDRTADIQPFVNEDELAHYLQYKREYVWK